MVTTAHEEGQRFVDNACEAHLMIDDVSVENNAVKCKCSVLAATDPAQVGKPVTDWFKYDGKAAGMLLNLAEATGLITRAQRQQAHDQGVGLNVDETQLKGKQFCGKIKMERAQRKNPVTGQYEDDPEKPYPYARIGFDTFSVFDKKAEGIPKDQQFLAMCQRPAAATAPASAPAAAPAQSAPATAQPAQQALPLTGPAMPMNW